MTCLRCADAGRDSQAALCFSCAHEMLLAAQADAARNYRLAWQATAVTGAAGFALGMLARGLVDWAVMP